MFWNQELSRWSRPPFKSRFWSAHLRAAAAAKSTSLVPDWWLTLLTLVHQGACYDGLRCFREGRVAWPKPCRPSPTRCRLGSRTVPWQSALPCALCRAAVQLGGDDQLAEAAPPGACRTRFHHAATDRSPLRLPRRHAPLRL